MLRALRTANLPLAAVLVLGGLSLSACATRSYVDEQIATVNNRISAVEARTSDAIARADAANATAQAAATDARNANARLDQLTTRVTTVEQRSMTSTTTTGRRPRN